MWITLKRKVNEQRLLQKSGRIHDDPQGQTMSKMINIQKSFIALMLDVIWKKRGAGGSIILEEQE